MIVCNIPNDYFLLNNINKNFFKLTLVPKLLVMYTNLLSCDCNSIVYACFVKVTLPHVLFLKRDLSNYFYIHLVTYDMTKYY